MNSKYKSLMAVLAAGLLAVGCTRNITPRRESSIPTVESEEKVQFRCLMGYDLDLDKKVPTTYAWRKRGKSAVVRWVRNDFEGAGYDPDKRCREASPRFHEAYENGSFKYLTNGKMNEQPVICTARSAGGNCDTLLFTLLPTDDGLKILKELQLVLRGTFAQAPLRQNTKKDQVYIQVDMEKFLRTAPVEEEP